MSINAIDIVASLNANNIQAEIRKLRGDIAALEVLLEAAISRDLKKNFIKNGSIFPIENKKDTIAGLDKLKKDIEDDKIIGGNYCGTVSRDGYLDSVLTYRYKKES